MEEHSKTYSVYSAGLDGKPLILEATYGTVAEVLAHCEGRTMPFAIKVGGNFMSLDAFMKNHVREGLNRPI
jgi:hypothetical protein